MKTSRIVLVMALLSSLAASVRAQEQVPLDADTVARLGLVFMPVAAPQAGSGARFQASVIASPNAVSELYALHGGVLDNWQVQAGQQVEAGAVLAVLRSPAVLGLQQEWMTASGAEQQASFALNRDERLFDGGIIAEQRLQESRREARQAQFTLQALTATLEQAGVLPEELQAMQDGNAQLGRYAIRSPVAGSVTHLGYRTGERVEAGAAVVALSGDSLWVSAEVPVRMATRIVPGQQLRLADGDALLEVRQMDKAIDTRTQTLGLLAEFTTPVSLLPGQVVTLSLPPQADGIVVPASAVVRNGTTTGVFVKVDGGVESRTLTLQAIGTDYLALEGLAAGEQVVVRGAALLKGIVLGLGGE